WNRRKQLRKGLPLNPPQSPGQLALGNLALATGGFDGGVLRFHRRDGLQDRVRLASRNNVLLSLQQREHLAVLLQFIAERFNDLFESRGHRSMTGKNAKP